MLSDAICVSDCENVLAVLLSISPGLGDIKDWSRFWQSKAWNDVTAVTNLLTKQNLAVEVGRAMLRP
jgi:hypothetical protein